MAEGQGDAAPPGGAGDSLGGLRDLGRGDEPAPQLLCRFGNGARGIVDFGRVATGRKARQGNEIHGTKGSLVHDCGQVNRLRFDANADDAGREHPACGELLPLANFAPGCNKMKIIEAAEVIRAIKTGRRMWPCFGTGHPICRIVDAGECAQAGLGKT